MFNEHGKPPRQKFFEFSPPLQRRAILAFSTQIIVIGFNFTYKFFEDRH
jgi:hypothetical protein